MAATGGINKSNTRVFGSTRDAVYLAPLGTPLPDSIDAELDPAFEHVGWISTDGITETFTGSKTEIRGHQGQGVVRTRMDTPGTQFSFTAMETKPQTQSLRYDEKEVTTESGVRKSLRGPGQRVSARAVVIDKFDADFDERHERDVFEQCDITPNGDRVFNGTEVASYPFIADVIGDYHHYETVHGASATPGEPTLTSVTPSAASEGDEVVLAGTDFLGVTHVRFGGVNAVFEVDSAAQITAIVPAGTLGAAPVRVFKGVLDSDAVEFTRE